MATQKKMRAMALDQFGGVERMKAHMLPVPEPGAGEVRIRVEAAGVGVWDGYEMQGAFAKMLGGEPKFPYVPGSDCAGTVESVGPGVTQCRAGDRVYAFTLGNPHGGAFAEYVVVKADQVSPIPGDLPADQAGAMPVDAMTALRGLEALQLKKGESVMIFGAGGGLGIWPCNWPSAWARGCWPWPRERTGWIWRGGWARMRPPMGEMAM